MNKQHVKKIRPSLLKDKISIKTTGLRCPSLLYVSSSSLSPSLSELHPQDLDSFHSVLSFIFISKIKIVSIQERVNVRFFGLLEKMDDKKVIACEINETKACVRLVLGIIIREIRCFSSMGAILKTEKI